MPRFFIEPSQIGTARDGNRTVLIMGDDAAHITKSLRMKPGERLTVCDGDCGEYDCVVRETGETVTLDVCEERRSASEPPYRAVVYQALVKGDKFDTVIQKAAECGALRIVPFISERCVVRLTGKDAEKKRSRWQRIALEAAKQCGRGRVPEVAPLMDFSSAVREAAKSSVALFCYEDERGLSLPAALKSAGVPESVGSSNGAGVTESVGNPESVGAPESAGVSENAGVPESISIMIGSEGGFSSAEAAEAAQCGMKSVSLGRRILRTETASSFVLACLSYAYEL